MEEFYYKDMTDYFEKNEIKSIDDWGIDELMALRWGLGDWLKKEFPYFSRDDVFMVSDAAVQAMSRRLKDGM